MDFLYRRPMMESFVIWLLGIWDALKLIWYSLHDRIESSYDEVQYKMTTFCPVTGIYFEQELMIYCLPTVLT